MFLECFYQLVSELRFHLGKCQRNPRGPSCSYRCTCWISPWTVCVCCHAALFYTTQPLWKPYFLFDNMDETVPHLLQLYWWPKQKISTQQRIQLIYLYKLHFTIVSLIYCISRSYLFHTKVSIFLLMRKNKINRILFPQYLSVF